MSVAISALVLRDAGFAEGTVLVEGNRIAVVGLSSVDRAALRERAMEHVDAGNCWLIPGLIDAHAHGYATLLRGTQNSMPLELWSLYTVLYGRAYDAAAMRAAILLGAAERIRAGITGWVDHSPMVHLAEAALAAHAESGLRVCWAAFLHDISDYALMDLKLPPEVALLGSNTPPFDSDGYSQRFGEFVQTAKPDRVAVMLGPNAPQRCSPEAWALWRNLRDRYGVAVHTHLMETRAQEAVGARWPGGLVAEMERQGLLDDRLSVAHGIWLTRQERAVLARHGVTLTHNPASNLMLGSGILPLMDSRAAGLAVAIGTDSANTGGRHDLFEAMRWAMMLPRVSGLEYESWPGGRDVLEMATRHGAAVLGRRDTLGRIAPGQLADLVLVRRDAASTLALANTEAALVQHGSPDTVASVMADGCWLMRNGVIVAFDEAAAIAAATDAIAGLRERTAAAVGAVTAAIPHVAEQLRRFRSHHA
ncbi:MAG TPA: amidohydrolase family protein [Acetobacteraceae bacterium]|nr:amidohydrolase family protein [Acetobacteraceae bacterium]